MFLAIEWTSTTFHAFLFARDATLLEHRQEPRGVNSIVGGNFEAVLHEIVGDWAARAHHIYLSGMITSRNGWVETPYAQAPASLSDVLSQAVVKHVDGLPPLTFLPGVSVREPLPDMMRGEELKVFGVIGQNTGIAVLPGSHTKWVAVRDSQIEQLATYMSGEINSLLRANSLVSKLIPVQSNNNPEAFMRGVRVAWNRHIDGGILRRIFSARSLVLFAELSPADISGYLSGLIIGAEIQEALDLYGSGSGSITLIGPPDLCDAYSLALNEAGRMSTRVDNAASQGFEALFRAQLAHY